MSTIDDLKNDNISKFVYDIHNYRLVEWNGYEIFGWGWHHFVKQQKIKRNPELIKYQKMIYFPPINQPIKTKDGKIGSVHLEADAYHSRFEQRWGIPLNDVVYRGR